LCINQSTGSTFNLLTLFKVLSLKKQLINKVASLEFIAITIDAESLGFLLQGGNLRAECRLLVFSFLLCLRCGIELHFDYKYIEE
jgi:hypothetical protein